VLLFRGRLPALRFAWLPWFYPAAADAATRYKQVLISFRDKRMDSRTANICESCTGVGQE
jgi:hypothetical protein